MNLPILQRKMVNILEFEMHPKRCDYAILFAMPALRDDYALKYNTL
jgi:hypothetical protein